MNEATFDAEWARCAPWLESALAHARGTHLLGDVEALVRDDPEHFLFFPGQRCAAVSQIIRHPRVIQCHHWLCGGDAGELVRILPVAEAHAILRGATLFTTGGDRRGWRRLLKSAGYAPEWDILVKDLTR